MGLARVVALALAAVLLVAGADQAAARERLTVTGAGVAGAVTFDDGRFGAGLQGWVQDPRDDAACAEVWMDVQTRPHHHFDAYAVRVCGYRRSGFGRYNKVGGPWGWAIRGIRVAACTFWPRDGSRRCTQQWPHDSVRAGTFSVQRVGV